MRKLFCKLDPRKAAGPDGITTSCLKYCAEQLAPVFTDLFNTSLNQQTVPLSFKTSTIIPVPKKPNPKTLNDYRPVALTPVAMKVFERLVLSHIKAAIVNQMDPLQFAYRHNRSVDDAVALALFHVLQHLDKPNTYVRMLFVDFSSAFNTILPDRLIDKMQNLSIDSSTCQWVLDFLLERPQTVRMKDKESTTMVLNTGAPQGCVLSPLLFSIYTNDCRSEHDSVKLIKFADDTTAPGLITNEDETEYRTEVNNLVTWCDENNLKLNTTKTQELIVDFRKNKTVLPPPLTIKGENISQVQSAKFLGTFLSDNLSWDTHVSATAKKAQQRLFFLRQLKKFKMSREVLIQFYKAAIESILTFSILVWYGNLLQEERAKLERVVKSASRIIGTDLPSLESLYEQRLKKKTKKILKDQSHPANHLFDLLPSGKRFRSLKTRTERFKNSFYPKSIRNFNKSSA